MEVEAERFGARRLRNLRQPPLFFENIRDFLGIAKDRPGRTTPNQEINRTVLEHPEKMLERNNGIVMRAATLDPGNTDCEVILSMGSIVNGCQTTLCLVESGDIECFVPIKIVCTSDSWDVAKAANYQNSVEAIDLDLARHLRPQLAKRAAVHSGVLLEGNNDTAFGVLDSLYDRRLTYTETRLLYIGLFSRTPNNLFAGNYTELRDKLIERFQKEDPLGTALFELLFTLQQAMKNGIEYAEKRYIGNAYAEKFKRFYRDDSPNYRCFVAILALSSSVGINISEPISDPESEYQRMNEVVTIGRSVLQNTPDLYERFFVLGVKVWMNEVMSVDAEEATIQRDMSLLTKRANFVNLYRKLCMEADVDDTIALMRGAAQKTS